MKWILCGLLLTGGCAYRATPWQIEQEANELEWRAMQSDAQGDHVRAAKERRAADKQRKKAVKRANYQGYMG